MDNVLRGDICTMETCTGGYKDSMGENTEVRLMHSKATCTEGREIHSIKRYTEGKEMKSVGKCTDRGGMHSFGKCIEGDICAFNGEMH